MLLEVEEGRYEPVLSIVEIFDQDQVRIRTGLHDVVCHSDMEESHTDRNNIPGVENNVDLVSHCIRQNLGYNFRLIPLLESDDFSCIDEVEIKERDDS